MKRSGWQTIGLKGRRKGKLYPPLTPLLGIPITKARLPPQLPSRVLEFRRHGGGVSGRESIIRGRADYLLSAIGSGLLAGVKSILKSLAGLPRNAKPK